MMWQVDQTAYRQAVESVMLMPYDRLPLGGSIEIADCAARLWWRHHGDLDEDEFYKTSFAFACEQIDRASADQSNYAALGNWFRTHGLHSVLDYGAGCGAFGFYMDALGFKVTMADLDTPAFAIARAYADLATTKQPTFVTLPAAMPAKYDAICLIDVLEHVPSPLKLFTDLKRHALNPMGAMVAIPTFGSSEHSNGTRLKPQHLASNDVFWGKWHEPVEAATNMVPVGNLSGAFIYVDRTLATSPDYRSAS